MLEKKIKASVILLIVAEVIKVIGYNLWSTFGSGIFYKCDAIAFFLLTLSVFVSIKDYNRFTIGSCFITLWLSLSNVIDEFLFDPTKIDIHEYLYSGVGVLLISWLINYLYNDAGS